MYCPNCGEKKEAGTCSEGKFFEYSFRRLELPYFSCGKCRLIYFHKPLVREVINHWNVGSDGKRKVPFAKIFKEAMQSLKEFGKTFGYKETPFFKSPR